VEAMVSEMVITKQVAQQRIRYLLRTADVRQLTGREWRNLDSLIAMFGTTDEYIASALLKTNLA
jgi:hypothetical protein